MPEQQIWSEYPLRDAIDKVTRNGRYPWELVGWTLAGSSKQPTYLSDPISNPVSPLSLPFNHPSMPNTKQDDRILNPANSRQQAV